MRVFLLEGRGRLARSTRSPAPSRQGEPVNFSRQVITHTRRSSRFGRSQTASRLRERRRWSIAPTDEFVGVWSPPTDEFVGVWSPLCTVMAVGAWQRSWLLSRFLPITYLWCGSPPTAGGFDNALKWFLSGEGFGQAVR